MGAMEHFASGVHRILVCKDGTTEVVGILSQLKVVKFLWDNATSFPAIDALYPVILRDLGVGTQQTISINGDRSLTDALQLMSNEGLTSVAVVDNALNVVGNISTADVKLLTNSSSLPLLKSSCIHFISVILSERGIGDGKDSFPVFHVTPFSTLAHTVAKLVGDKEGVLKNEAVADAGDRERLTGTFAGETKNREGAVPGADGGRRF